MEDTKAPVHSVINVKTVASSIEGHDLWCGSFRMSPKSCIFLTPSILSRHSERAYKPNAFSIGPLHHKKKHLRRGEHIKFQYLTGLVSRVGIQVEELVEAVAKLEPEARKHYGEQIGFNPEKLVQILVRDGCFLIEFLRKRSDLVKKETDDPVFSMSCMSQHLFHDLILLENQIPWIILDQLFTMTSQEGSRQKSLVHLALEFLKEYSPDFPDFQSLLGNTDEPLRSRHLLELLRNVLVRITPDEPEHEGGPPIPSATELENAGITLKKSESLGPFISFKNGILEISPLTILDITEAVFRNIIAFEQCSHNCPPVFTSYAILLDNLINTTEDINRLSKKGIVSNSLNPDDATEFFNKLYQDAYGEEFYYSKVCADVKAYCGQSWPTWRASLVRNYCSNPWVIASTIAASVLLVLTFLQTVYTIRS